MSRLVTALILMAAIMVPHYSAAQIVSADSTVIDADSLRRDFDRQPYFGLYKDNYFIFGTSIGPRPTKENSNVKFQLSIAQRLTRSILPWDTYLFLFYTQKVQWNVCEKSFPMADINFNPGIGLVKPLFVKDRFIGKAMVLFEHESNGRDGKASRSWNRISFGGNIMIEPNFIVHGKFWIPFVDGENNRDLLDYTGLYQVGVSYFTPDRRFGGAVTLVKRRGKAFNYNTVVEFNYRIFKNDNQYLFVQYYNGYGEFMLTYNKFVSALRVGIVIKPKLFSDY